MTSSPSQPRRQDGFSLIEMIGVLAIIAILAVIIVPKVFSTIASSRLTNAVGSVNSMKSAVAEFAAKNGTIPLTTTNSRLDDLLIAAGMMDQRFLVKVGTQPGTTALAGGPWALTNGTWAVATGGVSQDSQSRLINLTSSPTAVPGANGTNYRLDGTNPLPTGSRVASAVIRGLTAAEAHELSLRIDGASLSENAPGTADQRGRVAYATSNGTYTAFIYLAHQ